MSNKLILIPEEAVRRVSDLLAVIDVEEADDEFCNDLLRCAVPAFYRVWAEDRVEAVARALYESRRDLLSTVALPGLTEAVGTWGDLTANELAEWRESARAALGLEPDEEGD